MEPPGPDPTARRTAAVVDVALAALTAGGICLAIVVVREPDARPPDVWAYLLGVAIALPLLVRRRHPRFALFASYGLLVSYYAVGYPAIGLVVPLSVALATVAARGHLAVGTYTVVVAAGLAVWFRIIDEHETALAVLDDTLRDLALGAAALMAGELWRGRRQLEAATAERLRLAAQERQRDADERVGAERLRLARELHDTVAHTITVIGVQADVADELLDDDPEVARSAMRTIRQLTGETLVDLRRTLGALRSADGGDELGPVGGLDALPELVRRVRASGLEVDLQVPEVIPHVPASVGATVHRTIQEALTNVLKHADATRAWVEVTPRDGLLLVRVTDDGRGAGSPATAGAGVGLPGMRERVQLLGGRFDASSLDGGGFEVRAELPLGSRGAPDATGPGGAA